MMYDVSRMRYAIAILLSATLLGCSSRGGVAQDRRSAPLGYLQAGFPVAVSTEGGPELVSIAEHLSTLIGHPRTAWKATRNPVCCFWVEINHWTAIPGQPGYVIVIHPGGSTLHASDLGQAREAVEFIEKHRRVIDGKVWLPLGVSTNFPISVPMLQATGRTRDD